MLPVTRRKVTVVPHSLAAVAAAVCLIAALAWEGPGKELAGAEQAGTEMAAGITTGRESASTVPNSGDERNENAREKTRERTNRDFQLISLLFPRSNGGG